VAQAFEGRGQQTLRFRVIGVGEDGVLEELRCEPEVAVLQVALGLGHNLVRPAHAVHVPRG